MSDTDAEYFQRINALNYTMFHDDGQHVEGLEEADVVLIGVSFLKPQIRAGKVKGLFLYADRRHPETPEVPTLAEVGAPDWKYHTWFGLGAPAGMPRALTDRASAEIAAIMSAPGFREKITTLGFEPAPSTPDDYAKFLAETLNNASVLIKTSGAKIE